MIPDRIDLHTHTTASDGSFSPTELVEHACLTGIIVLGITDHDTVAGLPEALAAGEKYGVTIVPGIEFSVDSAAGSLHLLGYGIDHRDELLLSAIERVRRSRIERNDRIIEKLNDLGQPLSTTLIQELVGKRTLGRGHIGDALVRAGHCVSVKEAFDRLLSRGKPAYVERYRLALDEAIPLIHDAAGAAVWAHPGLHKKQLGRYISELPRWKEIGLDGIESDYSQHSLDMRDFLRVQAEQFSLIVTGGSDFHGDLKPDIHLGDGPGGELIDPQLYNHLGIHIAAIRSAKG